MGQVARRLTAVRQRLDAACVEVGRDPGEVRLMAVSKTHAPDLLREAYEAGQRLYGENKVQEAVAKAEALADLDDICWAFVGHLQTNKAREVARFAAEFHALDTLKVARALDRRLQELGRGLGVFVQVNSSGEDSKFGLPPDEVLAFASALRECSTLQVRGLMTLAAHSDDERVVRSSFATMQTLQDRLRDCDSAAGSYDELSMGMSGDFELAIEYGATTVRVGQAVFGARPSAADS